MRCLLLSILLCQPLVAFAQDATETSPGDKMLADYFQAETEKLAGRCLTDVETADDWLAKQGELRRQLLEMLGLDPLPKKTDLKVQITGEVEHADFTVKNVHFQSRPGLYVTGNLYVPKEIDQPLPAILYVCGHGRVRIDGVDYGNKVHYQHHPAWFARNGYVCLSIDTLQLGEIEGVHHGTYREGMWWWLNRGYTPAGVEAWNCVRALDFLQSLNEVDGERIGVTGRSGGGAYSWWIAAIDERIKCAVPVAGITDLENHVVDGCVEGHCDCMYMVNTYRWDYPMVAALVAPRPLLISNTDSDTIFPLDGVYRTYEKVKKIYTLLGAKNNVALHITAGPHSDTQELRVHAFRWMNKHLKGDAESAVLPAEKFFEPTDLKVFNSLPEDEANSKIQEHFVAPRAPEIPPSPRDWRTQQAEWMSALEKKVFRGWPTEPCELNPVVVFTAAADGLVLRAIEFDSQPHVRLQVFLTYHEAVDPKEEVELTVLGDEQWRDLLGKLAPAFGHRLHVDPAECDEVGFQAWARTIRKSKKVQAYFAPRGIGASAWNLSEKKQVQNRRRFYLLGQTRDGMQAYDVRRAVHVLQADANSVSIQADGFMAGIVLYASLFEPNVTKLHLNNLPATHRYGPIFLNVRRFFDMPQAVSMAVATKHVVITGNRDDFHYSRKIAELIDRADALEFLTSE